VLAGIGRKRQQQVNARKDRLPRSLDERLRDRSRPRLDRAADRDGAAARGRRRRNRSGDGARWRAALRRPRPVDPLPRREEGPGRDGDRPGR
jgi:hypothetical protein